MGAAAAVAIIIKRERDLVDHFRRAGATSPEMAQTPFALGVEQRFAWDRLVDRGVIRTGMSGTFYLDEASWEALRRRRPMIAVGVAILMVSLAILIAISASVFGSRPRN